MPAAQFSALFHIHKNTNKQILHYMCVFLLLFLYYSSNNNLENEISNAKSNMLRVIERAFECQKPWNSYKF